MKPWAVYCRVSDDDQVKGVSIDVQRESCVSYLKSIGVADYEVIVDDGYSAWKPGHMRRPGITRILHAIEERSVAGVAIYAYDRFMRRTTDLTLTVDRMVAAGIHFVCVTMRIDTTGPFGEFLITLFGGLAQLESRRTSDRVKGAVRHIKAKGGFWGGPIPAGLRSVGEKGAKRLEVDPVTGPKMARVWPMVIDGASLRDVAAYLNREVPSFHGKPWAANTVSDYLRLGRLVGLLVTRETFDQAVAVLDQRWSPRRAASGATSKSGDLAGGRRPTMPYLLAGLATCLHCGAALTASYSTGRSERVRYYRCSSNNRRGKAGCAAGPIPANLAEEAAIRAVRSAVEADNGKAILDAWGARVAEVERASKPLREEADRLRLDRDRAQGRVNRLIESLEDAEGAAGRAVTDVLRKRQEEVEALNVRLAQVEGRMAAGERVTRDATMVRQYMLDGVSALASAAPEAQADGLRAMIRRIAMAVDLPRIELELVVDPPSVRLDGGNGGPIPTSIAPLLLSLAIPVRWAREGRCRRWVLAGVG